MNLIKVGKMIAFKRLGYRRPELRIDRAGTSINTAVSVKR